MWRRKYFSQHFSEADKIAAQMRKLRNLAIKYEAFITVTHGVCTLFMLFGLFLSAKHNQLSPHKSDVFQAYFGSYSSPLIDEWINSITEHDSLYNIELLAHFKA